MIGPMQRPWSYVNQQIHNSCHSRQIKSLKQSLSGRVLVSLQDIHYSEAYTNKKYVPKRRGSYFDQVMINLPIFSRLLDPNWGDPKTDSVQTRFMRYCDKYMDTQNDFVLLDNQNLYFVSSGHLFSYKTGREYRRE